MISKTILRDGQDYLVKFDLRSVILIGLVLGLVFLLLLSRVPRGERATTSSDSQPPNDFNRTSAWNPLSKLKDFFQSRTASPQPTVNNGTVRVVSEESQVINVVQKASPAVVSIVASGEVPKMEQCLRQGVSDLPPEFQQFFGNIQIPSLCQNGTEKRRIGAGSGFLVSADGYILTNKHVVADEKAEYTVVLNDDKHFGKKVIAKVLARDPNNDVAVLKIDLTGLPYLVFGDSSKLQVGQTAIAIGYALGEFDNTVSKGVVSGLKRSLEAGGGGLGVEQLRGLIQTDAAINPGNSGGPLLDISGSVIGMNVAMAEAQSIGFAIPINAARLDFEQVKMSGKIATVDRPFVGVRYIPITSEVQAANKLPYDYGMLVVRGSKPEELAVVPSSPADKAGIVENDIILEVNGKQLNERYMLMDAVEGYKPGETVTFKIYHKGEEKTVIITLDKQ